MTKPTPNFLICGAARSGTTFLVKSIGQHPEIYLPAFSPEAHYFYYSWKWRQPWDWYLETYFKNVKNEKAIGEKSTSYMYSPEVPQRMYAHLQKVKLIFLLRNPIERVISNYKWSKEQGHETLDFETALTIPRTLQGPLKEVKPFDYIQRSRYYEQISRFLKFYSKHQVLILKSEEMFKNPLYTFKKVYDFLQVCAGVILPDFVEINKTDNTKFVSEETREWLCNELTNDMVQLKTIIDFDIEDWK